MIKKPHDPATEFLADARGRLLPMPNALWEVLEQEVDKDARTPLDAWFKLQQHDQAPRALVAIYKLSDDMLTVVLLEAHTRTLHWVLEGSASALPLLAATIARSVKVPVPPPDETPGWPASLTEAINATVADPVLPEARGRRTGT
jgi:hypothetical protein